ncbi:MAG: ATPase, partial [Muribaculaceae bacterium]|nr:ATPase [Muribaculaceae bacterium]
AEGRPLFVRSARDSFNLANFMRANLYASVAVLKIGNDILFNQENVEVLRLTGHGGLFKTPGVGQSILAAALGTPISVMATAGEGGAWGIAILAAYCVYNDRGLSLPSYLNEQIFLGQAVTEVKPDPAAVAGFGRYIEAYKRGLAIEHAAVENKA